MERDEMANFEEGQTKRHVYSCKRGGSLGLTHLLNAVEGSYMTEGLAYFVALHLPPWVPPRPHCLPRPSHDPLPQGCCLSRLRSTHHYLCPHRGSPLELGQKIEQI